MIRMFAALPYQPMVISSVLNIPWCPLACVCDCLGGSFIFTATTTQQVGFSRDKKCKNSVIATNLTQTISMYINHFFGFRISM